MNVRKVHRTASLLGAAAMTAAALAGCSAAQASPKTSVTATAAYVQVPSSTGKATVAYLDIRNNGPADTLESVTTSVGGTVEFRAPAKKNVSPVVMRTIGSIPVPSEATTQLIPNSYHLLIAGEGAMHDGKDITLTLRFAHAGSITVLALVTNPQNGGSSYFVN